VGRYSTQVLDAEYRIPINLATLGSPAVQYHLWHRQRPRNPASDLPFTRAVSVCPNFEDTAPGRCCFLFERIQAETRLGPMG